MDGTGGNAEVVDGEGRVQPLHLGCDLGAKLGGPLVAHHRVHVDGGLDVMLGLQLPLNVVDDVVDLQQVAVSGDLGVKRHHGPAGAVVVIDQVVDAQNIVVPQHQLVDVGGQIGVHGAAKEGVQGLPRGLPPGL